MIILILFVVITRHVNFSDFRFFSPSRLLNGRPPEYRYLKNKLKQKNRAVSLSTKIFTYLPPVVEISI
jgi:hypothetical protein